MSTTVGLNPAAVRPRYPFRTVEEARRAAKAPSGTAALALSGTSLGFVGAWQLVSLSAGDGVLLTISTFAICGLITIMCLAVASRRRRWPADGSPQAADVAAWNLAACQVVVPMGWSFAVAAGGCAATGIGAGYVALIGWPRAHPGVVEPAWISAATAMLVAFGAAAGLAAYAVPRLRDPHTVLARQTATNPAYQVQRTLAATGTVMGAVFGLFGVVVPLSFGTGGPAAAWVFCGVMVGGGGLLIASGVARQRQLARLDPTSTTAAAVRTDPRKRGMLRLAAAGALAVVAGVVALYDGVLSGGSFVGFGAIPGLLAALGLHDLFVKARHTLTG